ncbi:MAG: hypothetical protein Q9212_006012, partial [Teloschistes hypoglaucus]
PATTPPLLLVEKRRRRGVAVDDDIVGIQISFATAAFVIAAIATVDAAYARAGGPAKVDFAGSSRVGRRGVAADDANGEILLLLVLIAADGEGREFAMAAAVVAAVAAHCATYGAGRSTGFSLAAGADGAVVLSAADGGGKIDAMAGPILPIIAVGAAPTGLHAAMSAGKKVTGADADGGVVLFAAAADLDG